MQTIAMDCGGAWLEVLRDGVANDGYAVVEDVVDRNFLDDSVRSIYRVKHQIDNEIGQERLSLAGELGVLRLMMRFDHHFTRFLAIPAALSVIDTLLSATSILHTQNGFVLPSLHLDATPSVFQNHFHMDFPRYLNGYIASINLFFAITDFSASNGATLVVPKSHQRPSSPTSAEIAHDGVPVECAAGSMFVFDSTLWHASGKNTSGCDRIGINHQFTRSFFKQQIDYVRALGAEYVQSLPDRTKQLLGWYTRVPTSLEEYYQPTDRRLYRAGQG